MLGAGRLSLPSSPSQLRVGLGGGDGHAVSRGFAAGAAGADEGSRKWTARNR